MQIWAILICMIVVQKPRLYKLIAARLLFRTCNDTNLALNVSTIALAVWSISFCAKPSLRWDLCKGGKISESLFNLTPKNETNHYYPCFNCETVNVSDLVRTFGRWGQIENNFWDFFTFTAKDVTWPTPVSSSIWAIT